MWFFLLWLGFAIWVFFDSKNRRTNKGALWAVGALFAGVVVLPIYFAKRNLYAGEVREGGTGWNTVKVFALYWTITMFVAGIAGMGAASRVVSDASSSAEQAGAAIGSMLGLGLLIGLWFAVLVGTLVIGLFLKKSSVVENGPTGELVGQEAPAKKLGVWMLAVWVVIACVGVLVTSGKKESNGTPERAVVNSDKFAELAATPPAPLAPTGELATMFNLGSDNTNLQRENKLKEIKGKVVEWTLPVYEVKKDGDGYKIQTATGDTVGAFIYVSPRSEQDKAVIEALKTGNRVSIKGIIKDDSMRRLVIKPAILFQQDSAKPVAAQAPPAAALSEWPSVNVTALIGKPASYINSDAAERDRYSKLVGNNAELDDYLTVTLFSDEDASAIQDAGDYLVIISKGIIRKDTGPMEGAYAIHKATGKPTAILLKGGEFTILGATAQSLPPPLKTWAKENGAAL